jgi:adhesin transport system outer membrane protein
MKRDKIPVTIGTSQPLLKQSAMPIANSAQGLPLFSLSACRMILAACLASMDFGIQAATLPDIAGRALARSPEILTRLHAYNVAGQESPVSRTYGQGGLVLQGRARLAPDDPYAGADETYSLTTDTTRFQQVLEEDTPLQADMPVQGLLKAMRRFELLQAADDVVLATALAYVEVLRQRSLGELTQADWNACRDVYDRRLGASSTARKDLLQASACVTRAQAVWLDDTAHLQDFSQRFERLVGEAPPVLADIPDLTARLSEIDDAWNIALHTNPSLQAAFTRLWIASFRADLKRTTALPDIPKPAASEGFDARYHHDAEQALDQAVLATENIRRAVIQYGLAEEERNTTCRAVHAKLGEAWDKLTRQRDLLASLEKQERDATAELAAIHAAAANDSQVLPDEIPVMARFSEIRRAAANARFDLVRVQLQALTSVHQILPIVGMSQGMVANKMGLSEVGANARTETNTNSGFPPFLPCRP